jgi:hypothetical protein
LYSTGIFAGMSQGLDFILSSLNSLWVRPLYVTLIKGPSKWYINLVIWSRPRVNTICAWVSTYWFSHHFLCSSNIFFLLWILTVIRSTHQEVCCTSRFLRLQYSTTIFQFQLLVVLHEFSGYNIQLPSFKFQYQLYFKTFEATIFIYHLSN